ncbi:berberine bridge enzyme-like 27 [Cynara cardunculus var. scolymus]|uniref:Berberine/berberine-like protein n=1 Tax=Cynara cardunculus var. scolymus TaxID=59895 RepID=A0A103XBM2_CYNCS|nr:berberine bridge enzyme-like 27 [Cynara cardunculus var. scolymus]KVH87725.1 Berberine/berberine-like protein [Cynara cardunculus var. scolymus]
MELKFFMYELVSIFLSLSLGFFSLTNSNPTSDHFLDCISHRISSNFSNIIITPNDASYSTVLQSTIQNLRFDTPETLKPSAIIKPLSYSHVQSTVICSAKSGLQIRIRSGGHDYEGLSFTSFDHSTPFILLDLNELRSVTVDVDDKTAWVESGATLGELSYWVSQKSNLLGFPNGECTSVGVGGHLSGGGYGVMARKYGLSADNVIDAQIVNVNGQILDRDSMGEDLFWAIKGGGGASFGVILAWKINLVSVPPKVTVFSLSKTLDQAATQVVNKWQYVGHNLSEDFFINLIVTPVSVLDQEENKTMLVTFNGLFLGTTVELMTEVNDRFSELGLHETDCIEMSWIESVVYYSVYLRGQSIEALKERIPWPKSYYKYKSDYVKKPIPEETLEEIWKRCLEENLILAIEPHGGRMSKIDESETPYPHREGNLYIIQYIMRWNEEGLDAAEKKVASVRMVYEKMTPFVSKNPREAYVNFRDLDLGTNGNACGTSYLQAARWGITYFKGNFRRLAMVKGVVDPTNFFCYEQSIPPLFFV